MTARTRRLQWIVVAGLASVFVATSASAQTNPPTCVNDIDCVATPQCGGDICDWSVAGAPHTCKPAGVGPKGSDGWCTVDEDCKCFALGARCVAAIYCTFTKPSDAPDAGAGTGSAGTSGGGAGTSGGGGGGGGCSVANVSSPGVAGLLIAGALFAARVRRRGRSRSSR